MAQLTDLKQKLLGTGLGLAVFLSLFGIIFYILVDNNEDVIRLVSVQVIVLAMAAAWLAGRLWNGRTEFAKTPLNLPIAALAAAGLISLFKAVNPYQGFSELFNLFVYFILFFLVVNNLKNESQINNFLTTILIITVIIAIHSICQYLGMDFFWFMFPPGASYARASSVFGNADFLGGYMAMVFPVSFLLFLFRKKRIYYGVASAAIFVSMLLTFTRSAWVSWGMALIFLFIALLIVKPEVIKRNAVLIAGSIAAFVAFAVILNFAKGGAIFSRLTSIFNWNDYNVQVRFGLWRTALGIFKKSPIIGIGFDNFKIVAQGCRIHNEYLQLLAETGIFGLGAFLWIIFAYFRQGFRSVRSLTPYRQVLVIAFMSSAVAFLADSLFCFPLHRVSHNVLFWSLLGMTIAAGRIESESQRDSAGSQRVRESEQKINVTQGFSPAATSRPSAAPDSRKSLSYTRFFSILVVVLSILAIFVILQNFIGIFYYQKGFEMNKYADQGPDIRERTKQSFEKAAQFARFHYQIQHDWAIVAIQAGELEKGIKAMQWSERLYPGKLPDVRLNLGLLYYDKGDIENAEKTWKETVEKFPDCAQAYFYLGGLYVNKNKPEEGAIYLKKASELDPGNAEYLKVLARIYYRAGNRTGAKEAVDKALKISPADPELLKMNQAL